MRPLGLSIHAPTPVALWSLLAAGHLASSLAPLPALLETPARLAAVVLGGVSLLAGARGARFGVLATGAPWRALELVAGSLAALLAGVALGAEADRAAEPLPVHPREVAVTLEGKVLDTTAIDAETPSVLFEARRVEVGSSGAAASERRARVLLRWHEDVIPPRWLIPGLWLRCSGSFRPPEDARNPGTGAPGRWLERMGVEGTVTVDPLSLRVPPDPPERGGDPGADLRDRLARRFGSSLSRPVAALARGMLLGDRSAIAPSIRDSFRDGGTIHILSISGLHVCILAGFLALFATALRLPLASSVALELLGLWAYVALVGAPASAVRSAFLWTAVRSGRALGTVVRPFTAWGLAGLGLHLLEPLAVHDPGFQLSFLAVLGLGAAAPLANVPGLGRASSGAGARGRALRLARGTWSLLLPSAGASIGTAGLQSRLFGAVPLVGLALNLAVIPLCTIFMAESVLFLAASCTGLGPLVTWAAGALELSGILLLELNRRGAGAVDPWVVRRESPEWALAAAALALLLAWGVSEAARAGTVRRTRAAALCVAALALSALAPVAPSVPAHPAPSGSTVIVALDVGQGDAIWIGLPGSGSLLVDAGPRSEGRDVGVAVLEPALRAEGRGSLDLAILSHAHLDHYGGFAWLARRGWVSTLWENGSDSGGAWRRAIARAWLGRPGARGFTSAARDTGLTLAGGTTLALHRGLSSGGENDRSIAALLRGGGFSVLLPGDLEAAGEEALLPRVGPVHILKAPHHGSRTSSRSEWVDRLRPRVLLVSCGERNRFGHPDAAVLGRYRAAGTAVMRTDQEGAIRITAGRRGAWISTRRHPAPAFVAWDPSPW